MLEYLLGDVCMCGSAGPAEVVEGYAEPLVDGLVEGVVVVTDGAGRATLLQRLHLRRSTVFISPADEEHVVAHQSAEPRVDVS